MTGIFLFLNAFFVIKFIDFLLPNVQKITIFIILKLFFKLTYAYIYLKY